MYPFVFVLLLYAYIGVLSRFFFKKFSLKISLKKIFSLKIIPKN